MTFLHFSHSLLQGLSISGKKERLRASKVAAQMK
jgi:hypothetical protein